MRGLIVTFPRKVPNWLLSLLVVALLGTQVAGQSHALEVELHDPSCSLCHSAADAELPLSPDDALPTKRLTLLPVGAKVLIGETAPRDNYFIRGPPRLS
jgi:hypothetical protein